MKGIRSLSFRAKLILCISFLSIVTFVVGAVGIKSVQEVADTGEKIYSEGFKSALYLTGIEQNLTDIHTYYLHAVYGGTEIELNKMQEKIVANEELIGFYEAHLKTFTEDSQYEKLRNVFDTYHDAVYTHVKEMNNQTATQLKEKIQQVMNYAEAAQSEINDMLANAHEIVLQKEEENRIEAEAARTELIFVTWIGILISFLIAYNIIRGITVQINELLRGVEKVASGDLDVTINNDSKGEIGRVAQHFNHMVKNLCNVVNNIESASEQVHMGAKQVAHTSSLLAEGATEQATTIEELTTAVEEIDTQIKKTADHSSTMNDIAVQTKSVVEKSHYEMEQMLKAMEDINDSSSQVSKIIKVIDDIAFQTNILALNAAVEAARAVNMVKDLRLLLRK